MRFNIQRITLVEVMKAQESLQLPSLYPPWELFFCSYKTQEDIKNVLFIKVRRF